MPTRWRWRARRRSARNNSIFLTDVEGVLDAAKTVRAAADGRAKAGRLIADGVATGGMQAKLNAARGGAGGRGRRGADRAGSGGGRPARLLAGEAIGTRIVLAEGRAT